MDSITNVVTVIIITKHDSQFGDEAFRGVITEGTATEITVQTKGKFPMRFKFSEIHSLNIIN